MLWLALAGGAGAQAPAPSPSPLPAEVEAALARARLPREALAVLVVDAQGSARTAPRLAHRAQVPVNPASVMKLVTTYAALEQLGPAYVWNTPVYLQGTVQDGSLRGNVYIQGQGDPKLVMERLWLLMRRLQGQGIQVIVGDIVLDRTAFDLPEQDPARFDGEPLRPYNAAPDALLLNFKSSVMTFVPDAAAGLARIQYDPPLAGVQRQATVALAAPGAECGDWRGALRAELSDPAKVGFQGVYPAACGERVWPVAAADPRGFAARAVEGMWRELGGKLTGTVRDGRVPAGLQPVFQSESPSLAEVVRDINKYSNNVMAQQVFLTMGMQRTGVASFEASRQALGQWWQARWGAAEQPVADNGAGLSREARITASGLGRMLQQAWALAQRSNIQRPSLPRSTASWGVFRLSDSSVTVRSSSGTCRPFTSSLARLTMDLLPWRKANCSSASGPAVTVRPVAALLPVGACHCSPRVPVSWPATVGSRYCAT